MTRRLMTIGMLLLMLSSCYYFDQVVDDIKEGNMVSSSLKKDGSSAYRNEKNKEEVYKAIIDISKRPINKKVQFEGSEIIIPEKTYIHDKDGNIVDLKTGYGIPINFNAYGACTQKKIKDKNYGILYNEKIPGVEELAQKIIKANGFVNTCK